MCRAGLYDQLGTFYVSPDIYYQIINNSIIDILRSMYQVLITKYYFLLSGFLKIQTLFH